MKKIKIGIGNIDDIFLESDGVTLCLNDYSNDGVIECKLDKLQETISIIENAYKNRNIIQHHSLGYNRKTINLVNYQTDIGKRVFYGNYILISHMKTIIKMLKSVSVEKEKRILEKDNLLNLCIEDLEYLNKTMKRRKRVLIDSNGCKYIEV